MFSCPQVKTITFLGFKALENEDTLLRTHIVAHDVSWAAQTGKQLLRTQNVSEQNQKHFVSATNVARGGKRGNLFRQQCVRNNASSFARAFTLLRDQYTFDILLTNKNCVFPDIVTNKFDSLGTYFR